jgi:hypothetical protein
VERIRSLNGSKRVEQLRVDTDTDVVHVVEYTDEGESGTDSERSIP